MHLSFCADDHLSATSVTASSLAPPKMSYKEVRDDILAYIERRREAQSEGRPGRTIVSGGLWAAGPARPRRPPRHTYISSLQGRTSYLGDASGGRGASLSIGRSPRAPSLRSTSPST